MCGFPGLEQRRRPRQSEGWPLWRHYTQQLRRLVQRARHHVVVLWVRDHLRLRPPRVQVKSRLGQSNYT